LKFNKHINRLKSIKMKMNWMLGAAVCLSVLATSCKTSESAYKKAYEEAKQQELTQTPVSTPVEVTPVVTAPTSTPVQSTPSNVSVREERVSVVSGSGLKNFSVVCGSFGVQANAEKQKAEMDNAGYNAQVAYNAEKNMYRVIVGTYDDRNSAAQARDAFKAKYPSRQDFQGAWLLYRVY
jgi:cell division protein FtsN